jgi:DNA topoisomerase-3
VAGIEVDLAKVESEGKDTKPPPRFTEAQLLRMMETAGELIQDEEELSDAMRERGLGTPATRADTIERLVRASQPYARRVAGRLGATHKGMRLIDVLERVHADLIASPKLTGEWEHTLKQVEHGERARADIQRELGEYTRSVTDLLTGFEHDELYAGEPSLGVCPECAGAVKESAWGYPCENNTGKDAPCKFMVWKDRYGRFVDRGLVSRLLAETTVGPVGGFVDRSGRSYLEATLTLKKDEEKGRWTLDVQFGDAPDVEPEVIGQPLWPCPENEGAWIVETSHRYVTDKVLSGEAKSGPILPKVVCHREMGLEEAKAYFSEAARTEILEGFISRRGRPFKGALIRKPTGKHGFEFPPRAPRGAAAADGDGAKKGTTRKRAAKKGASAKSPAAKKTGARKSAAKATSAKKATAKKATAKKATAKKATAKKATAKKATAKKATAKKTAAKKATAKKPAARKSTAKTTAPTKKADAAGSDGAGATNAADGA